MTNEDVCKAAESYEDGLIYSSIKDQCDIQKAFKEGADWRINTAWHDATEVPKKKGYILVRTKCFGFVTWHINVEPEEWNKICKDNQVVEWAYIEDLIPNKERLV